MYGSSRFKLVFGTWEQIGWLTFNLALSDSNPDAGLVPRGKAMGINANFTNLTYASGADFGGFLMQKVDQYGTTGDAGFRRFTLSYPDIPAKKGSKVSIMVPAPNSIFEFEGPENADASVANLIVTNGAYGITADTPAGTLLTAINGCIQVAAIGDTVIANVINAGLTPENDDEIRVRVQMVAKYLFSSEDYYA